MTRARTDLRDLRELTTRARARISDVKRLVPKAPVLSPEQRRCWDVNGYLIVPAFFDAAQVAAFDRFLDDLWANRHKADNPLVIDVFTGGQQRHHFRDVPDDARRHVYKLNDVYLIDGSVRELALDVRLTAILGELFEGEPCVINSLNFEYGSQQPFHFDTWYMPPPVEGKLVVSFIALEDIDAENGPLQFYPGSHRMPPYRFSHGRLDSIPEEHEACERHTAAWIAEEGLRPHQLHCRAGDLFIWHPQLFHGGSVILDHERTRRSLVTHYFRAQDLDPALVETVGPGRHIMRRDHQKVPSAESAG